MIFHVILPGLLLTLTPVYSLSRGQEDISVYRKRLDKIEQERTYLRQQIRKLDKKKTSVLSQLDKIGFEKKLIQNNIARYNLQVTKANSESATIQKQIFRLTTTLEEEQDSVAKILVTLYKFGNLNYLDFIFRATDVTDLMAESKHLTLLAQYQDRIVLSYLQTLNELKETEEKLEAKKKEVESLISRARQKKKELDTQEKSHRVFIRRVNQDRKTHLKTLDELKVRADQLQKLIDGMIREKSTLPFTVIPLYEKKGSLPWPTNGKIVTNFGIERHPKFLTETQNNGIEISTNKEAVVTAVHPGKVVYADYFQGFYGNLIIIDHGLAYYSMYGHCSNFKVQKGDIVNVGQPIARVGDTGSFKGTALYFQINFKTEPQDPLQWLKRR